MGSGLLTQIGTAEESTYGTPVTPSKFYELTGESLDFSKSFIESQGLRAISRNLRRRGKRTSRSGAGDLTMEVPTVSMGRWFKHMVGGTPTSAQQGGTAAWLHTYSLGALTGKSLTIQKGIEEAAGVIKPFTFHGCKILGWEFGIGVDELLTLNLTIDAEDVDTSTSLAAASYPTLTQYDFTQGALKVAGSTVASVTAATVGGTNNLKSDNFYLGSLGLKGEPKDNDFPTVQGQLTAEFVSQATFVDRFINDTAASLVLEFTGAVISGIYSEILRITVPEVRFSGELPKVGGPDVVVTGVPYEGHYDGTNPGVKIEMQTTDTTAS